MKDKNATDLLLFAKPESISHKDTGLPPCPFCGGEALILENDGTGIFEVACFDCGASIGGFDTEEEAKEAWASRV